MTESRNAATGCAACGDRGIDGGCSSCGRTGVAGARPVPKTSHPRPPGWYGDLAQSVLEGSLDGTRDMTGDETSPAEPVADDAETGLSPRAFSGLHAALGGVLSLLLATALRRTEVSGAVPAAEFPPARPAYGAVPWLLIISLGLLVWAARRALSRGALDLRRGTILAAVLCAAPPALFGLSRVDADIAGTTSTLLASMAAALILCGVACVRAWHTSEAPARRLTVDRFGMLRAVLSVWALAAAATLVLGVVESFAFTSRFVPTLVTHDQLFHYRLSLGSLAFSVGAQVAAIALVVILSLRAAWWTPQDRRLAALEIGVSVWLTLLVLGLFQRALHSELIELGLWPPVIALVSTLFAWCLQGLRTRHLLVADAHDPKTSSLVGLLAALPGRLVGPSSTRRRRGLHLLLVGTFSLALLTPVLYPAVEDFRMQLFGAFAQLAVLIATGALLGLSQWFGRDPILRTTGALLLIFCGAMIFLARGRPDIALVAHEYSRVGALHAEVPLCHALQPFPRIGLADPNQPPFPHHVGIPRLPSLDPIATKPKRRFPIIIVLWDAGRPDHCSLYGYARKTTTNLDALGARSLVFDRAYSTATATTTSVKGLLSGTYSTRYMLAEEHPPFFVRELADQGYDHFIITVTGNDYNGVSAEAFRRSWAWQQRDIRFEDLTFRNEDHLKPDRQKTEAVIASLRRLHQERGSLDGTFTYLHLTGPHIPWTGDEARVSYGTTPTDLYDAEMHRVDELLGDLLSALNDLGHEDDAALVICADHGTGLGEHGKIAGYLPYEEQLRVPLVMHLPGVPPTRSSEPVTLLDVAPTILNLLRPNTDHRFHGRSLLPLTAGTPLRKRPFIAFCAFWDSYAVYDRTFRFKLHHHRGRRYEALYDLAEDPEERTNLIAERPRIANDLRDLLAGFLWEGRHSYGNPYHYRPWSGPDER